MNLWNLFILNLKDSVIVIYHFFLHILVDFVVDLFLKSIFSFECTVQFGMY